MADGVRAADAVGCPLCGHASLTAYAMAPILERAVHVAQWRCPRCELLVSYPAASPERLAAYYQGDYYERVWPDSEAIWNENVRAYETEMRLLDRLTAPVPLPSGSRVLEVGCGYGSMLHVLATRGYDARGCEMSARAARFCASRGLTVVRAAAPGLPFGPGTFAMTFSAHVVEHVVDPAAFVGDLVRVTMPGGVVALVTEHRWTAQNQWDRARAALSGRVPRFHTSTDHTFVFAPAHLERLLRQAGCGRVEAAAYDCVPAGERLHWRAYKGTLRAIDRLLGWGQYVMVVGWVADRLPGHGG